MATSSRCSRSPPVNPAPPLRNELYMARTESNTELALGSVCPAFELQDVRTGQAMGRDDIFGGVDDEQARHGLLVAFLSVHCPFVQHVEAAFGRLTTDFADRIASVAMMSNDIAAFPQDGPEPMRDQAARLGWCFPYLIDEAQETAREFHAACTPDLYLFDRNFSLVYHGQFDNTRPYRASDLAAGVLKDDYIHIAAHGNDLRRAVEALVSGAPPLSPQQACLGCNIKWREA